MGSPIFFHTRLPFGCEGIFLVFDIETNIRLTRTNSPVEFHARYPLFQVQPLLRQCYSEPSFEVVGLSEMSAADWQNFEATMKPNTDQMRRLGHYAVGTRRQNRQRAAPRPT